MLVLTKNQVNLPHFVKTARIERMEQEIKEIDKDVRQMDREKRGLNIKIVEMILSAALYAGVVFALCLVAGANYAP